MPSDKERKGEEESSRDVDTGHLTTVITGTSAEELGDAICNLALVSRLDHALYLGKELARAQRALETGEPYEQDEGE